MYGGGAGEPEYGILGNTEERVVTKRHIPRNPPRRNTKMCATAVGRGGAERTTAEDERRGEHPSRSHQPHMKFAGRPLFPFRRAGGDNGATVRWRRENTVWCRKYTQNPPRGNTKMYARRVERRSEGDRRGPSRSHQSRLKGAGRPLFPFRRAGGDGAAATEAVQWRHPR